MLIFEVNRVDGVFMRLWLNLLACAASALTIPASAYARGTMVRPIMKPAMAAAHGGHGFAGKSMAGRPAEGGNPEQRFHPARQAFAVVGGGYGFAGYPGEYVGDGVSAEGVGADDRPPPVLLYRYERPPQLSCFRPRLIVIGRHPVLNAHLPRVTYGGPLPCGFKEAEAVTARSASSGPR
jgi:hypothetical protein